MDLYERCGDNCTMKKLFLFLFFVFLMFGIVYALPQIPIQIYGDINPALPDDYDMSFQIGGEEFETGVASNHYGYMPDIVKVAVDDPATTMTKEGYAIGDMVFVYINDVLVDQQNYDGLEQPIEIDIILSNQQYEDIVGDDDDDGPSIGSGRGAPPASGRRPPGCFNRWNCTDWGECSPEGLQSRVCIDEGTCNDPQEIEYQQCTYIPPFEEPVIEEEEPTPEVEKEPEPKEFPWLMVILIVVLAGGFGVVFYEIEKSRKHTEGEKQMHHKEVHPNTYANLESYIKRTIDMGYSRAQIRQKLLQEGWSVQILNQVFPRIR